MGEKERDLSAVPRFRGSDGERDKERMREKERDNRTKKECVKQEKERKGVSFER